MLYALSGIHGHPDIFKTTLEQIELYEENQLVKKLLKLLCRKSAVKYEGKTIMYDKTYMKSVDMTDIANMILLADGVLSAVLLAISLFNEDGIKLSLNGKEYMEQLEKDKENKTVDLVETIIYKEKYDLSEAVETMAGDLAKRLSPIKRRVVGMFRNGVSCDSFDDIYADPSVSDDWLFELFAMRIRDRMIAAALERLHNEEKVKNQQQKSEGGSNSAAQG